MTTMTAETFKGIPLKAPTSEKLVASVIVNNVADYIFRLKQQFHLPDHAIELVSKIHGFPTQPDQFLKVFERRSGPKIQLRMEVQLNPYCSEPLIISSTTVPKEPTDPNATKEARLQGLYLLQAAYELMSEASPDVIPDQVKFAGFKLDSLLKSLRDDAWAVAHDKYHTKSSTATQIVRTGLVALTIAGCVPNPLTPSTAPVDNGPETAMPWPTETIVGSTPAPETQSIIGNSQFGIELTQFHQEGIALNCDFPKGIVDEINKTHPEKFQTFPADFDSNMGVAFDRATKYDPDYIREITCEIDPETYEITVHAENKFGEPLVPEGGVFFPAIQDENGKWQINVVDTGDTPLPIMSAPVSGENPLANVPCPINFNGTDQWKKEFNNLVNTNEALILTKLAAQGIATDTLNVDLACQLGPDFHYSLGVRAEDGSIYYPFTEDNTLYSRPDGFKGEGLIWKKIHRPEGLKGYPELAFADNRNQAEWLWVDDSTGTKEILARFDAVRNVWTDFETGEMLSFAPQVWQFDGEVKLPEITTQNSHTKTLKDGSVALVFTGTEGSKYMMEIAQPVNSIDIRGSSVLTGEITVKINEPFDPPSSVLKVDPPEIKYIDSQTGEFLAWFDLTKGEWIPRYETMWVSDNPDKPLPKLSWVKGELGFEDYDKASKDDVGDWYFNVKAQVQRIYKENIPNPKNDEKHRNFIWAAMKYGNGNHLFNVLVLTDKEFDRSEMHFLEQDIIIGDGKNTYNHLGSVKDVVENKYYSNHEILEALENSPVVLIQLAAYKKINSINYKNLVGNIWIHPGFRAKYFYLKNIPGFNRLIRYLIQNQLKKNQELQALDKSLSSYLPIERDINVGYTVMYIVKEEEK